jgi:4-hydroxy-4-methyl-2-oxoglutarate aldolase
LEDIHVIQVYPRVAPADQALIEAYRNVSPSTIGHLTDHGFMCSLRALAEPVKLVGTAVTVRIPHLDSTAVHVAVDLLQPGDVLVVSMSGDVQRACFGGMVAYATWRRQAAGAVIDGAITDLQEIRRLGLPVFYRQVSALTTRVLGVEGEVNVPISVDGAVVLPGDLILGNEDGVMVVPRDRLDALHRVAAEKEAAEPAMRARLDAGQALADLSGARKFAEYRSAPMEANGRQVEGGPRG